MLIQTRGRRRGRFKIGRVIDILSGQELRRVNENTHSTDIGA
jgi:hypothetical protein